MHLILGRSIWITVPVFFPVSYEHPEHADVMIPMYRRPEWLFISSVNHTASLRGYDVSLSGSVSAHFKRKLDILFDQTWNISKYKLHIGFFKVICSIISTSSELSGFVQSFYEFC